MTYCSHPQPDSPFKRAMERQGMKDKLKVVPSDLIARYKSDLTIREHRLSGWPHVWPESQGSKVAYEYETERLRETIAALETLTADNARLQAALTKIEKWHGEFPATDEFWDNGNEMSYAVCFGSNGERDYMRMVARQALSAPQQPAQAEAEKS